MAKAKAKLKKAKSKPKVKPKSKIKTPAKAKSKVKAKKTTKPQKKVVAKKKDVTQKKTLPVKLFKPEKKQKLVDVSDFVMPLDDRIVVQIMTPERVTPAGLIIPDTVVNVGGNREGVVLAVGRGHQSSKGRLRPMDVKKGDKVLIGEYVGSKINYQGQDLVILRETEVMGVLDKGTVE